MITRKLIQDRIQATEIVYEECWEILCRLKCGTEFVGKDFFGFQPLLASALYKIQNLRKKIHSEKDMLIRRRAVFDRKWFTARMSRLKIYLFLLDEVIGIGKCLGDCFMWPFFSDKDELLAEHHKNERQFHMPTGIGGMGELSFITRVQTLQGCLVFYHGITSFLRIGDVSLYNPRTGNVVAIGEIKSSKLEDNIVSLSLTLVGKKETRNELVPLPESKLIAAKSEELISEFHRFRLSKQVERMKKAFEKLPTIGNFGSISEGNILQELQEVLKATKCDKFVYRRASKTLLFCAYKLRKQTIAKRLLNGFRFDFMKKVKAGGNVLVDFAKSATAEKGQIVISSFYTSGFSKYSLEKGTVPLLWWPLDLEDIRKVIFQEIRISTIYAPINFVQKLRDNGCEVVPEAKSYGHKIFRQFGNYRLEVIGFETFVLLVQRHLIPEEAIVSGISNALTAIEKMKIPPKTVNINIQQVFS